MSENNLINRKNKSQLIEDLMNENFKRRTCSFYKYVKIKDPQSMRQNLLKDWSKHKILGRVYIAYEGINAQLSIPDFIWDDFILSIGRYKEFSSISIKEAIIEGNNAFIKLIIKVKNKLVADGLKESEYNLNKVGNHLSAQEFNDAMEEPNSIIIDMRN